MLYTKEHVVSFPTHGPATPTMAVSNDRDMTSLAHQGLSSVPSWVESLTSLTRLDLSGNRLTSLPKSLGNLTSLTELDLSGNRLTSLPKSLGNLRALTTLSLGRPFNPVGTWAFYTGVSMRKILSATAIEDFDELETVSLSRLSAVSQKASGNRLTSLPKSLGNLTSLTKLDLSGNRLTSLPKSLGNLTSLTKLDLSGNRLTSLPKSLGNLTSLTKLDLSGNRLTSLPKSLGNLTSLTELDLSGNLLTTAPQQLADLEADGLKLELADNPGEVIFAASPFAWEGELLDRAWMRFRPFFAPSVPLAAVYDVSDSSDPAAAVLKLYDWERDRLLTLAKGTAGAAITVLAALIATVIGGKARASDIVLFPAVTLVVALLLWGGFLLIGLNRLTEEYTIALRLRKVE